MLIFNQTTSSLPSLETYFWITDQAPVTRGSLLCEANKYISKLKIHIKEIVSIITNIWPYQGQE